jgi:HupE/UreJ protein
VTRRLWTSLAALLLSAAPVRAHDVSYAHAEVRWLPARVEVALTVHPDDAAMALGVPMPEWFLEDAFLARAGPALADSLRRRFELRADGRVLAWRFAGAHRDHRLRGVTLSLVAPLERPAASLEVVGPVFPFVANHETFVSVFAGGRLLRQDVLTLEHRVTRVYSRGSAGTLAVLRTFVPAGIHHIAIGPDHILFVLGLLLLGGGLVRLLKIVTAFTAAHSITLALAALGIVHVSSRVVEPLIALSIVFVAFETLRSRGGTADMRGPLAFGFGLVHGFGFASVLAEFGLPREALGWALAGFNLGVEIGQACIVVTVAPALALLARRAPAVHARCVQLLALGIAAAGGFWLVQRLMNH